MLFKKSDPKYSAISSSETSKVNLVAFELKRLVCFSAALCLILSLISYFPTDPSWSTWSSNTSFQNWMGRFGSCLADLLFQLFGLCAFTLALLPALFALRFPIRDESEKKGSLIGAVLLL